MVTMVTNKSQVLVERVGRHELVAHLESAVCVLNNYDLFKHVPQDIILKGLRRGKALKRAIASKLRELKERERELNEMTAPWAGLVAYEKRKKREETKDVYQTPRSES